MPSAPKLPWDPADVHIWRHTPLCHRGTIQKARRWWNASGVRRRAAAEPATAAVRAAAEARRAAYLALPEWCYAHEHPLRLGRPGKLYRRCDFVTPTCDSIDRLCGHVRLASGGDAFGFFEPVAKKRKLDGYDEQEAAQAARAAEAAFNYRNPGLAAERARQWRCVNGKCDNTDRNNTTENQDGSWSCNKCGFVCTGVRTVATHRERLGAAEEDDKTKHAERVRDESHKSEFDGPPKTTEQRAAERRAAARGTNVPERIKGLGRVCDAVKEVERDTEKEMVADNPLTLREQLKRMRILEHLEVVFKQLAPVDKGVQSAVRMAAAEVWLSAVRHSHTCTRDGCCEWRLVDRNASVIASAAFAHTIDAMVDGDSTRAACGVAREHLLDLQGRMERSTEFGNMSSNTQMRTAKSMVRIMCQPGFVPQAECNPLSPPPSASSAKGLPSGLTELIRPNRPPPPPAFAMPIMPVPLRHCDSTLSSTEDDAPSPTSELVQLRRAIETVFVAYKSELPVRVKDGAVLAIRTPATAAALRGVEALGGVSQQATAFVVLNAVARAQADASPDVAAPSFSLVAPAAHTLNVPLAQKLKLDLAIAEEAIAAIVPHLPTEVATTAAGGGEDDLFT